MTTLIINNNEFLIALLKFLHSRNIKFFTISCNKFPFLYTLFLIIPKNISPFSDIQLKFNHISENDGYINSVRKVTIRRENLKIYKTISNLREADGNKFFPPRWQQKGISVIETFFESDINFNTTNLTSQRLKQEYTSHFNDIKNSISESQNVVIQYSTNKSLLQPLIQHIFNYLVENDIPSQYAGNFIYIPTDKSISSNDDENNL